MGREVGRLLGDNEGDAVGKRVGRIVGSLLGPAVGGELGAGVGGGVGALLGWALGTRDGCGVGAAEGGQAQPGGGLHTGSTQQVSVTQKSLVRELTHLLLPVWDPKRSGAVEGVKMMSGEEAAVGAGLGVVGWVANNARSTLLDASIKLQCARKKNRTCITTVAMRP